MAKLRKILRAFFMTLLLVVIVLPAVIYMILSTPWAQDKLREVAVKELSVLLGSPVEIGRIDYNPFNTIAITSITVRDDKGKAALAVGQLQARFEMAHFLRTGNFNFDYALIDAPEVNLYRAAPDAPLNIQPILDRLAPKDKNKPPTEFNLKIGTVVIRYGRFNYDVLSEQDSISSFNRNHIHVKDLSLHAYLRSASRDNYDFELESFSFSEKSGFKLDNLTAKAVLSPDRIYLSDFMLKLPETEVALLPVELPTPGFMKIKESLESNPVELEPALPIHLSTADFACLVPKLGKIDRQIDIDFQVSASLHNADIRRLTINDSHGLEIALSGDVDNFDNQDNLTANLNIKRIAAPASEAAAITGIFNRKAAEYVQRAGSIVVHGKARGDMHRAVADLTVNTGGGAIVIDGEVSSPDKFKSLDFAGNIELDDIHAGEVLQQPKLGNVSLAMNVDGSAKGRELSGNIDAVINSATWDNHTYSNIALNGTHDGAESHLRIESPDPAARFTLDALGSFIAKDKWLNLVMQLDNLEPEALNISVPRKGLKASGMLTAELSGSDIDDIEGLVRLDRLRFKDADCDSLDIALFKLTATRSSMPEQIVIESDFLNGKIEGEINPSTIPAIARDFASHIVPSLIEHSDNLHQKLETDSSHNDFTAEFTLENAEHLSRFLHLPVQIIYPVEIGAALSSRNETASLNIDAPYLQQGDKIIDSTVAGVLIDANDNRANIYATTHMPTKKGPMTLVLGVSGAESRFDTKIDWNIDRKIPLNGKIDFSVLLSRAESGNVCVSTNFNPGQINFGDEVWEIATSTIDWCDNRLTIDKFALAAGDQKISIDGVASPSPDDVVTIDLKNIVLISIFETLEIDNALLTGTATGTFKASQALSKIPILTTDCLHVDDIGYNYCVLGNADISAMWDNEKQSFYLDADIVNPQGQHSRINGDIFPAAESLDLNFLAENVKVGFMQPFMSAFASDISGYVSGKARLFGTFHDIDMEGDVYAKDLRLRIDFTNTYYTATDSIHIRPGRIQLDDITLHDVNGHTALLNGVLTHDYFHSPVFDFKISEARDFLSYNVTSKINPDWYGTIYGNGSASVKGRPGVINIGVDMATAPGSTFTFVLSDRLEAEQYSFITFNDATIYSSEEILMKQDDTPEVVKEFQARMKAKKEDKPSNYIMDIKVDITPDAQMILVMDPVGGDRIRAFGAGNLHMTYDAIENDLRMYGTYTLDRGSYNFTLQDIIIKDFTINPGSSITFRGDPYSASLDLEAIYQVNANLSDLDESFTQDKDLNRTNVPVQALLKVTGDMRQPDIAFDLAFPTLTSDTYRKVRSIISTDEMMNRQIIYLLALNRFYTPDYMSTTKGNELFSVASSTIASRLSSMLGKLSDNWSIAPNLRSDRGDFSDVEVDVALSSRLLNNRLLFNGNFGYRDKSLNTNQFIGDFDIEYLLTPRGTWRLKAYNRYNDQNYYVRTTTTTQGVGIMFRRDFDTLFPSRRNKKHTEKSDTTTPSHKTDSIAPAQVTPLQTDTSKHINTYDKENFIKFN